MKMRKLSKIILLILSSALFFLLAACGEKPVSIEISAEPRVVYVLGSDLDLSQGELIVNYKGRIEKVALNSEEISVSGYDKNKAGEQELTISYKNLTTSLIVTVYPAAEARNYETDYFVGEPFDRSKGSLRVVNEDGTLTDVLFSDESVTFEGFDSAAENEALEITASYRGKEAVFSVAVHEPETVEFTPPNKLSYDSHESDLDLSGCYLTLTAKGGALERFVNVTADMVSGFDPSAATIENRTRPLTQELTVSCMGKTFTFSVNVTFSDISLIQLRAEELSDLDWSGDQAPSVSDEAGKAAVEALRIYLDMTSSEKDLLTNEQVECVVRPAVVWGYGIWKARSDLFSRSFLVVKGEDDGEDSLILSGESYAAAKEDYETLASDDGFRQLTDVLYECVSSDLEGMVLYGTVTVSSLLAPVYEADFVDEAEELLGFLIGIYDNISVVPEDWSENDLIANAERIEAAYDMIVDGRFSVYRTFFDTLSAWDGKIFDVLYAYFYYVFDSSEAVVNPVSVLAGFYLPGALETLYVNVESAYEEIVQLMGRFKFDTTDFIRFYTDAMAARDEILQSGNELYKALYEQLAFDGLLSEPANFDRLLRYLRTADRYGYLYLTEKHFDDPVMENLWSSYLDITEKYFEDNGYIDTRAGGEAIADMFETFVGMSAMQQYGFLQTMNVEYRFGSPEYALDFVQGTTYNYFTAFVIQHYNNVFVEDDLPESAFQIFLAFLTALEANVKCELNIEREQNWQWFSSVMLTYGALHDGIGDITSGGQIVLRRLTEQEREIFDGHLGFLYEKLNGFKNGIDFGQLDLGEWEDDLQSLSAALEKLDIAKGWIEDNTEEYAAFITAFLNAEQIALNIEENAPIDVLTSYYYELVWDGEGSEKISLNTAFYLARSQYVELLNSLYIVEGQTALWLSELYTSDLWAFARKAEHVIWAYLEKESFDGEKVESAMDAFLKLTEKEKAIWDAVVDAKGSYRAGVLAYLKN